jgi:hypothetical protein
MASPLRKPSRWPTRAPGTALQSESQAPCVRGTISKQCTHTHSGEEKVKGETLGRRPCGWKHESEEGLAIVEERLDDRQSEGTRLPWPRLAQPDQVPPCTHEPTEPESTSPAVRRLCWTDGREYFVHTLECAGDGLGLDLGRLPPPHGLARFQQLPADAQLRKRSRRLRCRRRRRGGGPNVDHDDR